MITYEQTFSFLQLLPALIKIAVNRIHVALIPQYNPEVVSALYPAATQEYAFWHFLTRFHSSDNNIVLSCNENMQLSARFCWGKPSKRSISFQIFALNS